MVAMILHGDIANIIQTCSDNGDHENLKAAWSLLLESYNGIAGPDKTGTFDPPPPERRDDARTSSTRAGLSLSVSLSRVHTRARRPERARRC